MRFEVYDTVIVLEDDPNEGIKKGDIGTIIMVYDTPNKAYEVEFVDEEGRVKYQGVFLSNQITKLK
ncbi:UNVERIFIED_ORG: ATP-dependent exoDNAse (exonuclease V) alpha subunit [Heyndrickxia coagulans]